MFRRFFGLFQKRARDAEMAAELEAHLDGLIERYVRDGLSLKEARYAALKTFGGVEQIKEAAREQRTILWLEQFIRDLRYSWRMLRKNRGFAFVAIFTLALGIGACTAVFSVINTSILHPLPYGHPEQLVTVRESFLPDRPRTLVSWGAFTAFRREGAGFSELAAYYLGPRNFVGSAGAKRAFTQNATVNYFSMLGVRPILGRDFQEADGREGAAKVVILSHRLWQSYFGGHADAVGQILTLDGQPATVIGIMPADFQAEETGPGMYMPLMMPAGFRSSYGDRFLTVVGRLKAGVDSVAATEELDAIASRVAEKSPETNRGWGASATSLVDETVGFARPMLFILLGGVGFLLLIACVNIANLLLARATSQQKEIAIRLALGAGRTRIIQQMVYESLFLAALGCFFGVVLAYGGLQLMLSFAPVDLPRLADVSVDGASLVFSCVLASVTGLGVGLVPALHATRINTNQALKESGRGSGDSRRGLQFRQALVVAEIALALILLVGSGLLSKSFVGMLYVDRGYEPNDLYGASIALSQKKYPTQESQVVYAEQLIKRLSGLPDISSVCVTNGQLTAAGIVRFDFARQDSALPPADRPRALLTSAGIVRLDFTDQDLALPVSDRPRALHVAVSDDYFSTLGIPLLAGRSFDRRDTAASEPVILINQEMAGHYFPKSNPVGQRIHLMVENEKAKVWRKIVGVVGDIRAPDPYDAFRPQIFLPFSQAGSAWLTLAVRVKAGTNPDTAAITNTVHAIDSEIPFSTMWKATQSFDRGVPAVRRFAMVLSGLLSCIALILAAVGVYGVMAYYVTQRTGEIGMRLALGAQAKDILIMILANGAWLVGIGLLLGVAGSLALTRQLKPQLYNLSPYDPAVFIGVPVALAAVALVACWLPARRATKIEPLTALREG